MTALGLIVVGLAVGLLVGRVVERGQSIERDAEAMVAYRALQCAHQENAGMSAQTRSIVMDAIALHEARFGHLSPRPVPHGSSVNGAVRGEDRRRVQHPTRGGR
jgi:hypothetical protein